MYNIWYRQKVEWWGRQAGMQGMCRQACTGRWWQAVWQKLGKAGKVCRCVGRDKAVQVWQA